MALRATKTFHFVAGSGFEADSTLLPNFACCFKNHLVKTYLWRPVAGTKLCQKLSRVTLIKIGVKNRLVINHLFKTLKKLSPTLQIVKLYSSKYRDRNYLLGFRNLYNDKYTQKDGSS